MKEIKEMKGSEKTSEGVASIWRVRFKHVNEKVGEKNKKE